MTLPVIHTERLTLMGFRPEQHLEDFTRIQFDPRVIPWFGGDADALPTAPEIRRQDTWRVMATFLGHWALRGYGQWALVTRDEGRFVGRAGLWRPEGWPGLEVGWLVDPDHWGTGYATEAGRAAVDFAFDHLDRHDGPVEEVISITVPHNTASRRVMEKVGLTDTGTTLEVRGHTQVLYRITRDEWLRPPPAPPPGHDPDQPPAH